VRVRDERPGVGDEEILTSWMMRPTFSRPYPDSRDGIGDSGVPPISWMISRKVSCMCFAWFTSCSENFAWNRSTGMPYASTTFGSISQYVSSFGIISPRPAKFTVDP
jgi:hypothetical protein